MELTVILCILSIASLIDCTRTLQIFNGTITEITCSAAAVPIFRLMDQEREYDSRDYNQLPDLFDIEAIPSPSRDNVTLIINGTEHSNNLTIMCTDEDVFTGQFQTLFTLILEFVSILPAPNNVQYSKDLAGYLQIFWEPPTLASNKLGSQNVRIDSRITYFEIYITIEESTIVQVYNASETSFAIGIDKIPCSFWFQVAAVNPAGAGERSPPQNLTFDCLGYMSSTSSTMGTIIEPIPASSGLAAWAISATTIAALLAAVCIVLAACLFTLLKIHRNGINRYSESAEKEIEMKQNEVYGINTRPL